MERPSRDEIFGEMTAILSKRSVCKRLHVGAMLVVDGRPISVGYNGPPSGFSHCEKCDGETCGVSIHAEINAIAFAAKNGVKVDRATMYCTDSPCINCAKAMVSAGIKRVAYIREYRLTEGVELLRRAGIEVERIECSLLSVEEDEKSLDGKSPDAYVRKALTCEGCHYVNYGIEGCMKYVVSLNEAYGYQGTYLRTEKCIEEYGINTIPKRRF